MTRFAAPNATPSPTASVVGAAPGATLDQGVAGHWLLAALIGIVYLVGFARLTGFPMQDYANHVARAAVMADLLFHHGQHFGQVFEVHLAAVPYVLPDLLLAGLVELFGAAVGAGLFTSLTLLSLPCALVLYARSCAMGGRVGPYVFLIGLYLSVDWFFIAGFLAFRMSLALVVVSLSLAELLRRRWSGGLFAVHVSVIVLGLLTHLTAPIFMAAALGASAAVRLWQGRSTLRRELALLAPLVLVLGAYFAVTGQSHGSPANAKDWAGPGGARPWVNKIRNMGFAFMGFDRHVELLPLLLFLACILLPLGGELRRGALKIGPAFLELLVLCAVFLGLYGVLPYEDQLTLYVDVRALAMVPILAALACLRLPAGEAATRAFGNPAVLVLAALLALVQLFLVARPLGGNDAWVERYRRVEAQIPPGAWVLPVHTEIGRPYLLHVGTHVVLDRGAIEPYLFSGNFGDPMVYFRYSHPRYAPDYHWYRDSLRRGIGSAAAGVDWSRVACSYDFLLVTQPYDPALIGVPTTRIASNDAGTLLAVDKRACGPADAIAPAVAHGPQN